MLFNDEISLQRRKTDNNTAERTLRSGGIKNVSAGTHPYHYIGLFTWGQWFGAMSISAPPKPGFEAFDDLWSVRAISNQESIHVNAKPA